MEEKKLEYEAKLNKILNGKLVKYYNVANFYLAIGGDNYELTPVNNTLKGHKNAHFISTIIDGKKLLYPNPSFFNDGTIHSEQIRELKLDEAFELSDHSGKITEFKGAEIDDVFDKYSDKLIGVVKKGQIEFNEKKFENKEEKTDEIIIEKNIQEPNKEVKNTNKEKTLEDRIIKLEGKIKEQQNIIRELEQVVNYQQKITYSVQQQFLEISKIVKELTKSLNPTNEEQKVKELTK